LPGLGWSRLAAHHSARIIAVDGLRGGFATCHAGVAEAIAARRFAARAAPCHGTAGRGCHMDLPAARR